MTIALAAAGSSKLALEGSEGSDYQPGVCNIGPAEIARRRRTGHIGVALTGLLFLVLVALNAPPLARFIVALPAAVAAAGYIQAALKFCIAFGSAGVFNFGAHGTTDKVEDREARARDRARAMQLGAACGLVGLTVGVIAVLLPV